MTRRVSAAGYFAICGCPPSTALAPTLLPAKTPADIVTKVGSDLARVMADPDTHAKLRQRGLEPAFLDARQMADLMKRDVARWRAVADRIKLTLD